MPTYAFRDASGDLVLSAPEFAKPIPPHALRPAALEHARRHAAARLIDRELDRLVAPGNPHVEPYDRPVPAAATRLADLARAQRFRVNLVEGVDRLTVEGWRADAAFRMTYVRGRAATGSWHEPRVRYVMTRDTRPVGVNKLSRTGLAGKRAAGVGESRLSIVASPHGVPCNVTEIEKRIRG